MSEKYFTQLNYTLANEDTTLEFLLVQQLRPENILTVGGSGARSLPLVSDASKKLHIIDLSREQLALIGLRKMAIAHFSLDEYRCFWGMPPYRPDSDNPRRARLFAQLPLPPEDKKFFLNLFGQQEWNSLLYQGKWERTFRIFSRLARSIMGEKHLQQMLWHFDLPKQQDFFSQYFRHRRWRWLVGILGNATMFNALLYRGHFVQKNIPQTHSEFYLQAFGRNFQTNLVRENFFLQLCFWGQIMTIEALPLEAQEGGYLLMQAIHPQIELLLKQGDLVEHCARLTTPLYDFISFSDVPSYFRGDLERDYLQKIRPALRQNAMVVVRYYLRVPEQVDLTGFRDLTGQYQDLLAQEKVQVYTIKIYQYCLNQMAG